MSHHEAPQEIKNHILGLAKELKKDKDPAFMEELLATWGRKAKLFLDQVNAINLLTAQTITADDPRGILVLTFSGSLLSIGPDLSANGKRWLEYSSIKLRTDVPDIVVEKQGELLSTVAPGKIVELGGGKLRRTSAAYMVAVCPADLPLDEQDKRIRESTIFLTNGFMKFNRSLQVDRSSIPDQFTMKSMTRYLAKKHNLTGNEAKQLLDDFIVMVETGMLLGETVPLGRLGKLSIKRREAQKARLVKHPASGEEMLVEAKPSMGIPKISFSSYIKDRAATLDVDETLQAYMDRNEGDDLGDSDDQED